MGKTVSSGILILTLSCLTSTQTMAILEESKNVESHSKKELLKQRLLSVFNHHKEKDDRGSHTENQKHHRPVHQWIKDHIHPKSPPPVVSLFATASPSKPPTPLSVESPLTAAVTARVQTPSIPPKALAPHAPTASSDGMLSLSKLDALVTANDNLNKLDMSKLDEMRVSMGKWQETLRDEAAKAGIDLSKKELEKESSKTKDSELKPLLKKRIAPEASANSDSRSAVKAPLSPTKVDRPPHVTFAPEIARFASPPSAKLVSRVPTPDPFVVHHSLQSAQPSQPAQPAHRAFEGKQESHKPDTFVQISLDPLSVSSPLSSSPKEPAATVYKANSNLTLEEDERVSKPWYYCFISFWGILFKKKF